MIKPVRVRYKIILKRSTHAKLVSATSSGRWESNGIWYKPRILKPLSGEWFRERRRGWQ